MKFIVTEIRGMANKICLEYFGSCVTPIGCSRRADRYYLLESLVYGHCIFHVKLSFGPYEDVRIEHSVLLQ